MTLTPRVSILAICAAAGFFPIEAQQRHVLKGHVPDAVSSSRPVERLSRSAILNLAIGLPLRAPQDLNLFLEQIADPASPNYRQYVTPEQFTDRFGPSVEDYQTLLDFAEAHGLTVVATHPNRTLLDVSGTVADIERAFHISLSVYQHFSRGRFFAPNREPVLDISIPVQDICGLDNFVVPHPMSVRANPLSQITPFVSGSGPAGLFIGKDFRAAYAPTVTLTGAGQTVGLIEFDGFYAADVAANFKQAGMTAVPVQTVLLDGFNGSPGSSNIEVTLDIMMAAYMAPGLSKILVYEGLTPNDILNRMATDNAAKQLSSSWGFWPINATTEQIFKQFIAQGQTYLQASGDGGAYKGAVMPPSDDPNVTSVGGTSLTTSGSGGPWQSETTWSGSGGGISTTYPIPTYQQGLNLGANGGSGTWRNIPDVALTADIQMFLIQNNGQPVSVGGTSAAAPLWAGFIALANQQAAGNGKAPVGFLNPLIYAIGKTPSVASDVHDIISGNNNGFSAVSGYDLATGWGSPAGQHLINDLIGTSGTPSFTLTTSIAALTVRPAAIGTATITVNPLGGFNSAVALAAPGLPTGVTATFGPTSPTSTSTLTLTVGAGAAVGTSAVTIAGTAGALHSAVVINLTVAQPNFSLTASPLSLTVQPGTTATSFIVVAPVNGFNSSVAFTATGVPTGVTASFSPSATTGTTSLTFLAAANAPPGNATVTVAGTSGTLRSPAPITLAVAPPDFTLGAAPASVSLKQGASATAALTITPQNHFPGTVSLAVSGLPAGVTASFSPAAATTTSTVTFAASNAAQQGTAMVTITGVSGSLSHTVAISLTVAPGSTGASVTVSLSPLYNVTGIYTDFVKFTGGGLDGGGRSYSAALLGPSQPFGGAAFPLGAANAPDAVTSKTIPLPSGQYSKLNLLATGVNGSQAAQTFTVTYTDNSTSVFTQSLSDWFASQAFSGESTVLSMPYRNNSDATRDVRRMQLYGYVFSLNAAKTVASISLPNNRNVVVLGVSLMRSTMLAPMR